ncbi:MAG: hypothetical protein ACK521_08640 [bacterium]
MRIRAKANNVVNDGIKLANLLSNYKDFSYKPNPVIITSQNPMLLIRSMSTLKIVS